MVHVAIRLAWSTPYLSNKKVIKMSLKDVASRLATTLGEKRPFVAYAVRQTPKRTMPLLQLIQLYCKEIGQQSFVENYHDESKLYRDSGGFLKRSADSAGNITISFGLSIIAQGQI